MVVSGGTSSEKSERNWRGGGMLTYFSNPNQPNFVPFSFDNFCRLLGFGGTNPPQSPPPRGAATDGCKANLGHGTGCLHLSRVIVSSGVLPGGQGGNCPPLRVKCEWRQNGSLKPC